MIPENTFREEARYELNKIKQIEETVDRENIVYRANKYICNFKNFRTTKTFGRDIYNSKITFKKAEEDQSSVLVEIMNFKSKIKPQNPEKKTEEKRYF